MPIDPGLIGPTTLAVTQAIGAFNTYLPNLSEIRKKNVADDPAFAADVRTGEVAAVALTVGVGVIVSSLTGSSAPAIVGLIVALGLVFMYETTLRADRPLEGK